MGSWLSYGLGSMNETSEFRCAQNQRKGRAATGFQIMGSGFLPGKHAGTRFRADKDAILYLNSPDGIAHARRNMLDRLKELHELQLEKTMTLA